VIQQYRESLYTLREQQRIQNTWLHERLENVLPEVMARTNVDIWLVICREYNEDPVIMSLLPEPAMSARRRTILAFCKQDDGQVRRFTLDRYGHGDLYESAWQPDDETQDEALLKLVEAQNPQRIGLNYSPDFAFGDGLSYHEYQRLSDALGDTWTARFTSAEKLCIGWLETRSQSEMNAYPYLVKMGHALIATAFSSRVIQPGVTTTHDVIWWMRQTMHDMGLQAWFQPGCEIQAPGQSYEADDKRALIQPGDVLWCDVGFSYLGLCTDQQNHAYVLKPGESDVPDGLKQALADANRLQDIHMNAMQIGDTGNEVLQNALIMARDDGLDAQIYSHPLGTHGHAAGPTIGLWDRQEGVPGRGDYPIYDNTAYSIELNTKTPVPEWNNQTVRIALEEDAIMRNGVMHWLDSHQTAWHLIG
jgi:Xaa-Pro aminopeptidase